MPLDLTNLCQLLYVELRNALYEAMVAFEGKPAPVITSLRVRIGEPPRSAPSDPQQDVSIPPELGWMADMTFDPRADAVSGTFGGGTAPATISPQPDAGGLFDRFPLEVIQGVGKVWRERFTAVGIATVGALAGCGRDHVAGMCARYRSHKPVEFYSKAVTSRMQLPLYAGMETCAMSILDLATASSAAIRAAIAPDLPESILARIVEYCGYMVAVLDDKVLRSITLSSLVRGN